MNEGETVSFGIMFNFTFPAHGIYVQPPADLVKEDWFVDELRQQSVDIFIIVGHMEVKNKDWKVVLDSIRKFHATTPM